MDLGTVKSHLNAGKYSSSEECFADIEQTFQNAYDFNPSKSAIHLAAKQMTKVCRNLDCV